MNIYLAGLYAEKNRTAKIFKEEETKVFLAGSEGNRKERYRNFAPRTNVLESYHYITKQEWMFPLIKQFKSFMLDSGAYTFMSNKKESKINWNDYVDAYGDFVRQQDIDLFFELDIDSIVGLREVERLRKRLETRAMKQTIPVWHKSRGKDYWLDMVKEYDYVAIGGIVTKEIKPKEYKYFHWLIDKAHENDCKVHGLGFTNLKGLTQYKFDSVDSTSWLSGNRFGAVYQFDGKTMQKVMKKEGQRVKSTEVALHNFEEWVKFSEYAEKHL